MKSTLIYFLVFTSIAFAKTTWLVEITNQENQVKKYQPDNKKFSLNLDSAPYDCSLMPEQEDHTDSYWSYLYRRLDCYNVKDKSSLNITTTCRYPKKAKNSSDFNSTVLFLNDANPHVFNRLQISCNYN